MLPLVVCDRLVLHWNVEVDSEREETDCEPIDLKPQLMLASEHFTSENKTRMLQSATKF